VIYIYIYQQESSFLYNFFKEKDFKAIPTKETQIKTMVRSHIGL